MAYIPTEVIADLIERWVARGRARDAAWHEDGVRRVMRFGKRRRLWALIPCAGFGFACIAFLVAEVVGVPLGFWLRLTYACVMFPLFVASAWHALGIWFTTAILSDTAITLRSGFAGVTSLEWSNVFSVKYSRLWSAFVFEGVDGTRLPVPTQMDGLRTLCDFFITRLPNGVIDPAVPIEMVKLI